MNRFALTSLIIVIAACSDSTTGTHNINILSPSGVRADVFGENPEQPASYSYSEGTIPTIPTQPNVQGNSQAFQSCFSNLAANNWKVIAERAQTLKWVDDHSPNNYIFGGLASIRWRFYAGTYQNQPIRCVQLDTVKYGIALYPFTSLSVDSNNPRSEWDKDWDFCWGNPLNPIGASPVCTNDNAHIKVWVQFKFRRNCNLMTDPPTSPLNVGAYGETYMLGGTPSYGFGGLWQADLYAVDPQGRWGFWTMNDYGAGAYPYQPYGWPGQVTICGRYNSSGDPRYQYETRTGPAAWLYPTG